MEITQTDQEGVVIIEVKGRLDTLSSSELENHIEKLINENKPKIVLDFSELDFISSSGLRVLLAAAKQLKTISGKMVLCALRDHVKEVFDVAGFTLLFSLFPSREAAIKILE